MTTKELQKAIPDFNWTGGHSGRILPPEQAVVLEKLWSQYLDKHKDLFKLTAICREDNIFEYPSLDVEYKEKKEDEDDILEAYVSFQGDGSVCIGLIDPDLEWSAERKTLNEAKTAFQQIVKSEFEDKTINYVYDGIFDDGDNQELYGKALELCTEKHAGHVDKAGKPYLGHIARVAGEFYDEKAIVALLHDIVEDTDVNPGELLQKGFTKEIVDAVVAITKKENESYESFIERVGKNKMAREVKIADLEDNMNIRRLPRISEEDMVRLNNYLTAWRYLISLKKEE